MELLPGLYRIDASFDDVPLALYLFEAEEGFVLVDSGCAGMPASVISPYLARIGARLSDVLLVVNTHEHYDHTGGNAELRDAGARVAAAAPGTAWIENHQRALREYHLFPEVMHYSTAELAGVLAKMGEEAGVDRVLYPGDLVKAGRYRLRVHAAPGHAAGGILLHDEEAGVLLSGDALQGEGLRLSSGLWLAPEYRDVLAYRSTLALAEHLAAELVLPSHHEPQQGAEAGRFVQQCHLACQRLAEAVREAVSVLGGTAGLRTIGEQVAAWLGYQPTLELFTSVHAHLLEMGTDLGEPLQREPSL